MNTNHAGILVTLAMAVIGQQARAYTTYECLDEPLKWASASETMHYATVGMSAAPWRGALDAAIDHLNQNPSPFRFAKSYSDNSVAMGNGQNEAWFSDDPDVLSGAPAITYTWWNCIDLWIYGTIVELTEADVIFDINEPYTTSMSKGNLWEYGGDWRPFQTTAIHELGHALGLGHENDTYNVMGQDWSHIHVNGSTARSYLGEDAANGAVYLYGTTNAAAEDVGVVHWKYLGVHDEYSTHTKTRVTSSNGGNLTTFRLNDDEDGEVGYKVSRNQIVRVEFSFENNGKTTQNAMRVRYYVSTNNVISPTDTELASARIDVGRNTVYTRVQSVTIPNDLSSGTVYYLGAVIDPDYELAEMVESNNATYLPIKIN